MPSPTQSDKTVEEILDKLVFEYGLNSSAYVNNKIDLLVKQDRNRKARAEALAALTARENRMVQEALRQHVHGGTDHECGCCAGVAAHLAQLTQRSQDDIR